MDTRTTEPIGPPPPTSPPLQRPPLRRGTRDTMLGGVCSGLGRYLGIDPVVLRVLFVVAVFAGGVGLLAYLAAWLLIPDDTDTSPRVLTDSLWRLVLGVLLALGMVGTIIGWLGSLGGITGVVVGGGIVGLGVWLYSRGYLRYRVQSGSSGGQADTASPLSAPGPEQGFAYGGTGESAVGYPDTPHSTLVYPGMAGAPASVPSPQPAQPRSYLGLVTLLVALVVAGLLGAGQALGLFQLSAVTSLSILLVVIAVGLLVGAFRGRARWLIAPALVLALAIGATSAASAFISIAGESGSLTPDAGIGERVWIPTAPGADYQLGIGAAELDLTRWARSAEIDPPSPPDKVTAAVGLGELVVKVPSTWGVAINASVGVGELRVNGESVVAEAATDEHSSVEYRSVLPAEGDPEGQLQLDLSVTGGEIKIIQVPVPPASDEESKSAKSAQSPEPANRKESQS